MSLSSLAVVANALRLTRRNGHAADGDAGAVASTPA